MVFAKLGAVALVKNENDAVVAKRFKSFHVVIVNTR